MRQHVVLGQRERLAQPAEADLVAGGADPAGEGVRVALDADAPGRQRLDVAEAQDRVGVQVGHGAHGGLEQLQHSPQRVEVDAGTEQQLHRGRRADPDRDGPERSEFGSDRVGQGGRGRFDDEVHGRWGRSSRIMNRSEPTVYCIRARVVRRTTYSFRGVVNRELLAILALDDKLPAILQRLGLLLGLMRA